jgi:hypothetical protein
VNFRSQSRATQRSERWAREDDAPRLREVAPGLITFKLELSEVSGERRVLDSVRVQHIMVPHAAALFEVPCGAPGCQDGGFDVTVEVLRALRHEKPDFSGSASCYGSVGDHPCQRELNFRGVADWSELSGRRSSIDERVR